MSVLKKTTIAVLSVAVIAGSVSASFAEKRGGGRAEMRFEKMDANSDGKLDFAEFSAPLIERFEGLDADSNGVVTKAEIEALETEKKGEKRRAMRIAKRFDLDGNEEVTRAELENRQQKFFALMDKNDDGFATLDEMPKHAKKRGDRKGKKERGDRG
ncbi:EF-hand domain-containing protein [Ahrensia marina]|uniref:EF-hand domain-containing protein n=1 Tax=Ahrensia marina TaxID=1514904 RepID=UPI0006B57F0E|nr:hypothetical protein [Ahrensia marina]